MCIIIYMSIQQTDMVLMQKITDSNHIYLSRRYLQSIRLISRRQQRAHTQRNGSILSGKSLRNVSFNLFQHDDSNAKATPRPVPLTAEVLDDFKPELVLNMEEIPSEESDALREAYRSLGFGDAGYAEALQGERGVPGDEAQLRQLRSQLREEAAERESEAEQTPPKARRTSWNVFVL